MNLDQQPALYAKIAESAVRRAPQDWTLITLEVSAMGNSAEIGAIARVNATSEEFRSGVETGVACLELRAAMYANATGTWYRAILRIDPDLKLDAEFDYDAKPYDDEEESAEDVRELLMYDHELYPRGNEQLPDWHPAKH